MPFAQHPGAPLDRVDPPVLACLDRRDFARARLRFPGFARWSDHREFRQERDALLLGYGFAGVRARVQRVSFADFERWTRLTGAPLDVDGLDEFAAHRRWRGRHPQAPVCGRFGMPGDPERNVVALGGAQCVRVRARVFELWRDDYARAGLLAAPSLDVYATHVVECCISVLRRARGPAVSSA